jgi:hypothetical protein
MKFLIKNITGKLSNSFSSEFLAEFFGKRENFAGIAVETGKGI